MIRVFLLDDHALVRTGYRLILQQETDIDVVGEAASGEEGLPLIRSLKPHVVLCDLHLPGMSGLEITERLGRIEDGPRVVIASVQDEGPMPRRLLEAGACAYVGKACPASELLRAIRDAARGKRYLAGDLAQRLALAQVSGEQSPFERLSPRELEVAMMICQGLRLEQIATRLSLSAKTVATHKARLFEKLGVGDNIALARLASAHGVTEPVRAVN
jgi:DNA-binding NarL/FixJ family response regulator